MLLYRIFTDESKNPHAKDLISKEHLRDSSRHDLYMKYKFSEYKTLLYTNIYYTWQINMHITIKEVTYINSMTGQCVGRTM